MLKANVGLSRKITRDFQSTGFSVNLDGEIPFTPDDPEAVLEKVKELYDLAQEAINREIGRDHGETSSGHRDQNPPALSNNSQNAGTNPQAQPPPATNPSNQSPPQAQNSGQRNINGNGSGNSDAATNKQVQFILTMSKRFKLSNAHLENRIGQIIGRKCGIYDLSKKEAGLVLDEFTNGSNGKSSQ